MTVAAKSPLELYDGDGVTTAFSARWRYLDITHLLVEIISAAGEATVLTLGVDYSAVAGLTDAGGLVTLASPLLVGQTLRIRRNTPLAQPTQYPTSGAFPARSHELALDRNMMAVQELGREQADFHARALMLPFGESAPGLPQAADRASRFLAFDPAGLPYMSRGTGVDAGLREDLAAPSGAGLLTIQVEGVGAKPQPLLEYLKNAGMKTPQDYNARGPGYDNTAPVHDWLDAVVDYQRGGLLLPMEYPIDEALDLRGKDLSGVSLRGIKGQSVIRGTDGIGTVLAHLPSGDGVHIEGIGFISDHVTSVRDYRGFISWENVSLRKAILRDLYFSGADCHTQAIFLATVTSEAVASGSRGTVDQLLIENVLIDTIGGQGITLMNRAYDEINGEGRMRNVRILRPEVRNTGLKGAIGTDNGLGISLDGLGLVAEVGHGLFENLIGIGIENTGFQHTIFHNNTGRIFTRGWALVGWHGFPYSAGETAGAVRIFKNCHSIRNRMVGDPTGATITDYGCMDSSCSVVEDYVVSSGLTAAAFRFTQGLKVERTTFKAVAATATSAVLLDARDYVVGANPGVANYNEVHFNNCEADMSASTAGGNAISFIGATATNSTWRGDRSVIKKGSISGYVGQSTSAAGNRIEPFIDETGQIRNAVATASASADADYTFPGSAAVMAFDRFSFSGGTAWTNERSFDIPDVRLIRGRPRFFSHAKEWPATFKVAGVAVSASRTFPNQTVMLQVNASGALTVTPMGVGRMTGSKTYDPPSIASGAQVTTTVTVNGALMGDHATASFSLSVSGLSVTASVTANNTVTVTFSNASGGAIDLASGTLAAVAVR